MLQIVTTLLSLVHKVFLLRNDKRVAWIVGIVAGIISVIYFYAVQLYVFSGLEIGLLVLMGYGLTGKSKKSISDTIQALTGILCLTLTYFSFSGVLTILEGVSSVGAVFGVYFLAHNRDRTGWIIWVFTHLLIVYVTLEKGQQFFVAYQVFSLIIAIYGVVKSCKHKV